MTLWNEQEHFAAEESPRPPAPALPLGSYRALVYLGMGERGGIPFQAIDYLRQVLLAPPEPQLELWDLPTELVSELQESLPAGILGPDSSVGGGRPPGGGSKGAGEASGADPGESSPPLLLFWAGRAGALAGLLAEAGPEPQALPPLLPEGTDLEREAVVWELGQLLDLTALLRRECPWDRKQTQESIVRYTLEETYELADAVERASARTDAGGRNREVEQETEREVRGELGDLLFQVYFLARVAEEAGRYDLGQVAAGIRRKLVRRHPHIFGETAVETAEDVRRNWDQIKRSSEGRRGIFHEVPAAFPALLLAQKLQARAAEVGFDWPDAQGPLEKVREEQRELEDELGKRSGAGAGGPALAPSRVSEEMGDVLFALVNLARKLKVDPELALRAASQRFRDRVSGAEGLAAQEGVEFAELDLDEQEQYYQKAKSLLLRGEEEQASSSGD